MYRERKSKVNEKKERKCFGFWWLSLRPSRTRVFFIVYIFSLHNKKNSSFTSEKQYLWKGIEFEGVILQMFINFYKKFFVCKNRKSTIYESDLEILTQMHSFFFSVSAYTLVTCTFYNIFAFHNNCIFLLKSYIRHKYTLRVLWNYVYSLRPKFVNYRKFCLFFMT